MVDQKGQWLNSTSTTLRTPLQFELGVFALVVRRY
jgi:hypothetical protein